MPTEVISKFGRVLRSMWWLLDGIRHVLLNLLLLALLVLLVWAAVKGGPPALQPRTALVLDLAGPVVEQTAHSARAGVVKQLRGQDSGQTRLRDVLAVLDAAAKDDKVTQALLVLDGFAGAGLPTLREIAAAIDRFKASGKPVYAWGSSFDQRQYYVASHASAIWLHPMGNVLVEGYGHHRSYYKELLDRVGISVNVLRAGKYKNAAETYSASAPSKETLESDAALYGSLWASWTGAVEQARKQPAGSVGQAIDSLPASLVAAGGDVARWALERKWVDALKTRDEVRALLIERGAPDEDGKNFRQIGFADYLDRIKPASGGGEAVGVIVAEGEISDGDEPAGRIGGQSTAELIRRARDDGRIKALVLRINSPGGSTFGSELVRRELELTRQAGKPVVVSMGDVAASGGYWIATAADEVIADEATITGSIGVIGLLPTAQATMDKLGVRSAGYSTTWLVDAYDPRRTLDPRFAELIQSSIDHVYLDFTNRVAAARKTTPQKIDSVAQGRVWSGRDALERGLVDRLGSYGDAITAAATRGKLGADYRVQYLEAEPGRLDRLLERFGARLATVTGHTADIQGALVALGIATPASRGVAQDLGWLAEVAEHARPFAAVTHCMCGVP